VNGTAASPCPLVRSSTIHGESEVTLQAHSRSVWTATLPEPPSAGKALRDAVAETAHFVLLGVVTDVADEPHEIARILMNPRATARRITPCSEQRRCHDVTMCSTGGPTAYAARVTASD
jgi:hypothetical protein